MDKIRVYLGLRNFLKSCKAICKNGNMFMVYVYICRMRNEYLIKFGIPEYILISQNALSFIGAPKENSLYKARWISWLTCSYRVSL